MQAYLCINLHTALNKMMGNRKHCNLYKTFQVQSAIPSVWKVQFQQFERFSVANIELFHVVCSTRKFCFTQNRPFHGY